MCGDSKGFTCIYTEFPFALQTDHEPLKYMNSAKFANGSLMRWAMFLQSYNFRVEAIKGSENVEQIT